MANPSRQHRLEGGLTSVKIGAADLEQWQYEITAGGRLSYAINDEERTLTSSLNPRTDPRGTCARSTLR